MPITHIALITFDIHVEVMKSGIGKPHQIFNLIPFDPINSLSLSLSLSLSIYEYLLPFFAALATAGKVSPVIPVRVQYHCLSHKKFCQQTVPVQEKNALEWGAQ